MPKHRAFPNHSADDLSKELNRLRIRLASTQTEITKLRENEKQLSCAIRETHAALKLATVNDNNMIPKREVRIGFGREVMTPAELAREIGVCGETLRRMCADGRLPQPIKIRGKHVFLRSEIHRWISGGCDCGAELGTCAEACCAGAPAPIASGASGS